MTYNSNNILEELRNLSTETEWVEFKVNNERPDKIGEYISAISNTAALFRKTKGYIVWGIENDTHNKVGTTFKPRKQKKGNESLENWLVGFLKPQINFDILEIQEGNLSFVIFEISPATTETVKFKGTDYIRIGSHKKKLSDHTEKEKSLWKILIEKPIDWSAKIIKTATIDDLDPAAILFAKTQYGIKYPKLTAEIKKWDNISFLNKAKLCINGKITNSALILLGKDTSSHLISPAQATITWILKDDKNIDKDYVHFSAPLILVVDQIQHKIRNLTIRHLPSGTLFPNEVTQYDPWVIRETLHNCIAHQDYSLNGKINVVETPNQITLSNLGSFIPGSIEIMIQNDAPPDYYRSPFLAQAMVNLNMIDTIGSGIKRMFTIQQNRSFPLPDYNLKDPNKVSVKIAGQILDENYTQLLLSRQDLDLMDVIGLDKVQKKQKLDENTFQRLKKQNLIEGRRPNLFVSSEIASVTGEKASYIKNKAFDKEHYKDMVIAFLKEYTEATREDLDKLLFDKLSDALDSKQKKAFITNLLQEMRKTGNITYPGKTRWAKWHISKSEKK